MPQRRQPCPSSPSGGVTLTPNEAELLAIHGRQGGELTDECVRRQVLPGEWEIKRDIGEGLGHTCVSGVSTYIVPRPSVRPIVVKFVRELRRQVCTCVCALDVA